VPEKIENVFFWPVALRTGKNEIVATDDKGHSDTATIYFQGQGGAPEVADALPISDLTSSNPKNPAYYMNMPVQAQWPLYYDLDSTADNSWNNLPPEIEGAGWIALRRVSKPDMATDVSFTVTKAGKVYVAATQEDADPAFVTGGQFKQVATAPFQWRDNTNILFPAKLYVHAVSAGEKFKASFGDLDAVVLFKAD
jgi:hypothetical protein